jgi:hypothetical protein
MRARDPELGEGEATAGEILSDPEACRRGVEGSLLRSPDHGDVGDHPIFFLPRPSPYVHPFPPKVTQSTQESAEGRKPKMTKRNGFIRCVLV